MKHLNTKTRFIRLAFCFFFLLGINVVQGQEWIKNLPQNKVLTHQLTLKDYQKAFNSYWTQEKLKREKQGIKNEKYEDENLEKFKRWEWYWQTRVNPVTGVFPHKTADMVYRRYLKTHTNATNQNNQPWISQGPTQSAGGSAGLGRINRVAFSPVDTNVLYVGSAAGGVWKTTDGGSNWTPLGDFNNSLGVSDMVVENTGGEDIIYLATGDKDGWDANSVGVLKSTDGGQSWNTTGLQWEPWQSAMIYRLLVDPNDNNTLYAATNNGLYKTTNAGQNWNIINGLLFRDLEFQPGSNTRMYGTSLQNGAIYYSEDKGKTWTKAIDNPDNRRTELAVSPDSANVVYAVMVNSNSGLLGIYRSKDAGQTYVLVFNKLNLLGWSGDGSDSGGQGWYDLSIAVDPHNANKIFVGGVNTWMSEDGGISWKLSNHWANSFNGKNDVVHADKHELVYQSKTNALFECNDGGIYKRDNGKHWDYIGSGLAVSQIYRLSTSATVNGEVITGLQDNGTKLFSGNNWNDVLGGDGMECLIDYTDANTQYGEYYYGHIYRTKDHWNTAASINSGLNGNAAWVTPYMIDPFDHNTLYIGYQDVFKSSDQGNSWAKISSWGGGGYTIQSMAISPSNSNVLYAATYNTLYKTTDGGVHWANITGSLPVSNAAITYIAVKNDSPITLWVTMGGYNNYGVFESTDGGNTWINISTNLPNIPINSITQNKLHDSTELFVGTDVGVFVRKGSSNWKPFNDQLPHVGVDELEIHYDSTANNATLYAATFGRGLWSVDISDEINSKPSKLVNGLQHYYKFDGTLKDVIENINGISHNTTIDSSGVIKQSVHFNGTNSSYIETNNNTAFNFCHDGSDFTISVWEKHNSADHSSKHILGDDIDGDSPGIFFKVDSTDVKFTVGRDYPYLAFDHVWDSVLTPDTTIWHHLVITYNGSLDSNQYTLYVDGINAGSASRLHPLEQGNSFYPMRFGINKTTGTIQPFKGELDELAFWNRTLNKSEISELYNSGKGLQYPFKQQYLTANFKGNTIKGVAPLSVHFTDQSTGGPTSWKWNFGNGGTSNEQNPVTTYDSIGNYTVTLTISDGKDTVSQTKENYIRVKDLLSRFTADTTEGVAPLTVHFTDQSVGRPTSRAWDFNYDGIIDSTSQNPSWIYTKPGLYSVALYVSNSQDKDSLVKTNYINVHINIPDTNFRKILNERLGYTYPETVTHNPTKKEMATITDLEASNRGITDITGAEYLVNCITLSFDNNNIFTNSISGGNNKISNYPFPNKNRIHRKSGIFKKHFRFTKVSTQTHKNRINKIKDFSPLAGLTKLQNLSLDNTGCTDISFLSGLTNLTWLFLESNNISDISALSNLATLQYLYLGQNKITDISPLSGLLNLYVLGISLNKISNANPLTGLTHLQTLYLGYNPILDLAFLNKMTQLTGLDISGLHLNNLSPITNLTGLTYLGIGSNDFSTLEGIENYTHLNFLDASNNPLYDIRGIETLPLQYVFLYNCRISDFSPLLENPKVMGGVGYLFLANNPASKEAIEKQIPKLKRAILYSGSWPEEDSLAACYPTPLNKVVAVSDTASLAWQANFNHKNGVTYDVYLGTDVYKQSLVAQGITSLSYNPHLQTDKNYWWRVESIFNGDTIRSGTWYFNTDTSGQVITADPVFPTAGKTVTITFHAALGNAGLKNFTGDVYAYTGVITDKSTSPTDWRYVKTAWNQNTPACKLTRIDTNLYLLKISPSIRSYYGVPLNEQILKLAFVFRSADGSQTGRMSDGGDIFYAVYVDSTNVPQSILLEQGWNIMSFDITPDSLNMLTMFQPFIKRNELIKVIDEKGNFIQNIPGTGWINTIGDMKNTEGYYIKISDQDIIKDTGQSVALPFNIPLQSGWNIMGYPLQIKQDAKTALQTLIDSTLFVKAIDEHGGFIQYISGTGWINTLGSFAPGEGYYIKVTNDTHVTLNRPTKEGSVSDISFTGKPVLSSKYFNKAFKGNPYYPMNIIVTDIDLAGYTVQPGDEIAAFDKGVCVGTGVVPRNTTSPVIIVASLDDPSTNQTDGYTTGDKITLRFMSSKLDTPVDVSLNTLTGSPRFTPLGTTVFGITASPEGIKKHLKSKEYQLNIYPNPAKGYVVFELNNMEKDHVRIEILNLNGKVVDVVYNKFLLNKNFNIRYNTSLLPPGIYTVRVIRQTEKQTYLNNYKMVIMR